MYALLRSVGLNAHHKACAVALGVDASVDALVHPRLGREARSAYPRLCGLLQAIRLAPHRSGNGLALLLRREAGVKLCQFALEGLQRFLVVVIH